MKDFQVSGLNHQVNDTRNREYPGLELNVEHQGGRLILGSIANSGLEVCTWGWLKPWTR